jgi:ribose transport system ATP-binding protein
MKRWRGRNRLIRRKAELKACSEVYTELSIRPANPEVAYGVLSGGNKQKILIGRLLLEQPDLYVLCEPTRGVDVRTRYEIYSIIRKLGRSHAGILIISSDVEDLLAVCDRIGVVADGHVAEPMALSELDSEARKVML